MVTLKRLRELKDKFQTDLLSITGPPNPLREGVEWGKGMKSAEQWTSVDNSYEKLWTLGFLPEVSNFNAPGMVYETPSPSENISMGRRKQPQSQSEHDQWIKEEKESGDKSGYVKAPTVVAESMTDDPFFIQKIFLPEHQRDGKEWMNNDTWRFPLMDAVFTTQSMGKRSGDDNNPKMLARLVDTPSLFGIRQMEIEENMKAQHRHGYEHGKKVEGMGKSLNVVDTFNKQVDYFWDDLPVKAYKRERFRGYVGRREHFNKYDEFLDGKFDKSLKKENSTAWVQQHEDMWITKERICHVCQNMSTPENDYGIFPLCQKCKGRD